MIQNEIRQRFVLYTVVSNVLVDILSSTYSEFEADMQLYLILDTALKVG